MGAPHCMIEGGPLAGEPQSSKPIKHGIPRVPGCMMVYELFKLGKQTSPLIWLSSAIKRNRCLDASCQVPSHLSAFSYPGDIYFVNLLDKLKNSYFDVGPWEKAESDGPISPQDKYCPFYSVMGLSKNCQAGQKCG